MNYLFVENLSSLHYDPTTNHLIASFRPQSHPTHHELYELITQPNPSLKISLQLIQTFTGSSINIILSRSKILHKNLETYLLASDNGSHGVDISSIFFKIFFLSILFSSKYGILVNQKTPLLSNFSLNVILSIYV